MKKVVLTTLAAFSCLAVEAKLVLSIEGGAGSSTASSSFRYSVSPFSVMRSVDGDRNIRPVLGANVSVSRKLFFAGVGVRYWVASSNYQTAVLAMPGFTDVVMDIDNRIANIYVPVHAGIHVPIKNIFFEGKLNAGPSFYDDAAEIVGTTGNPRETMVNTPTSFGNTTKEVGVVGGIDLGIGTRVSRNLQMQLKYSFMSYLTELEYDSFAINTDFIGRIQNGRPNIHAIMLEASVRL